MKRIILFFVLLIATSTASAQCTTTATLSVDSMDCGDSVEVVINSFATALVQEVFYSGGPNDTGWVSTSGAMFTNPYIPSPPFPGSIDPDGGTYFWMGQSTTVPTALESTAFDVSFGGQICFDFVYANGNLGPDTEQPDQYDEGISLQYSTDGGTTWVDIVYYAPNGDTLGANPGVAAPNTSGPGAFETWTSVCVLLPPGALTSNTSFQWIQLENSGACCDHWGLDNIQILAADPTYALFDIGGNFIPTNTFEVSPTQTTTYSYLYTNGIDDSCYTTVELYVNATDAGPDIQVACDGLGTQLMSSGVNPSTAVSWSPGATLSDSTDANPFALPLADTEYILTSACGVDTVQVNVEESFLIDIVEPDTICLNGSTFLNLSTSPTSVSIASVEWDNASLLNSSTGNQVLASPVVTTQFVATVSSDSGCVIQDSVVVQVQGVAATLSVYPEDGTVCLGTSVTLEARVDTPDVPYTLVQGAYSPYPTTGTQLTGLGDDNTQGPIPIPFSFPFFGNSYNSLWLSSNGFITFTDPSGASGPFNGLIPNAAAPNNMIAWAWDNLDFTISGTYNFYTAGTAPNRYMVFNFLNVAYDLGPAGITIDVQVVIHESGLIEINNINIVPESTFSTMTQGIENLNGTQALANVDFNNTNFTSIGENWSFVPFAPPANPDYSWTPGTYLNTTQGASVITTPLETTEYFVTMVDGYCSSTTSYTVTVPEIYLETTDHILCVAGDTVSLTTVVDSLPVTSCLPGYQVSSIPYALESVVNGTGTSFGLTGDDQVLGPYNLGFDFNYFCQDYSQFWMSTNGWLTFTNPFGGSDLSDDPIPTATGTNNVIAFAWDDLRFNTGTPTAEYFIQGTGANQKFIFQFLNVEHYAGASNLTVNIQVVMYPDGTIEMHNISVVPDGTFGTMTQGIENVDGTSGFPIPGHNNSNFTSVGQSWRFTPNATSGNYTVNWTPNSQIDSDTTLSPNAWPSSTTDYIVQITTDEDNCSYYDTATVSIGFEYTLSPDMTICEGDTAQLEVVANADFFAWSPNDATISDVTISNPTVYPITSTTYFINMDSASCSVQDSVVVNVSPQPNVLINGGALTAGVCDGMPANLVSDADSTWTNTWTGPVTGNGTSLTTSTGGTYTLISANSFNCADTTTITVDISENPVLDPDLVQNIICCNDEVVVVFQDMVTNNVTIGQAFWDNGTTDAGSSVVVNAGDDGTYNVLLVSVEGCEDSTEVTFTTNCINPDINEFDSIALGGTLDYTVATDYPTSNEVWTPNFTNNTFLANTMVNAYETVIVDASSEFTLNDGSTLTCTETDSSLVYIFSVANPLMPDAFTPNGDNLNDKLFPVNVDPSTPISAFRVYNRWGELVYDYNGDDGWDGKWKDAAQPEDVYNYYLVIDKLDEDYITSGTITLIR